MLHIAGQEVETSLATDIAAELVRKHGRVEARRLVIEAWRSLSVVDSAALAERWDLWARSKQNPRGEWASWGYLTGRGFGKTKGISKFINGEVEAGRARLIGLAAQDEANAIYLQVLGPSGLIATAPPWFKPRWEASALQLVWPNGARAIVRTPEAPGKIRGFDYDLAWLSELSAWSPATQLEAFTNFKFATRLGLARTIWDSNPKRGHTLLKDLLAENLRDPNRHVIVRGTTHENAINLSDGYIEELEAKYGGTAKGREELLGEMLEESERALVKQAWIDQARRHLPETWVRHVVSVDPAVTSRHGNDRTGIVEVGSGADGQAYVISDRSGRYTPGQWADIVLDLYVTGRCDCVVVETNKGGELVTQNLRARASQRGLQIVKIERDALPRYVAGTVYIKEVHARGPKEDRAQPLATAYERGRVSHVIGADLAALEDLLTSWEPTPGARSPDALDATVHGIVEILGLADNKPDLKAGFKGISKAAETLTKPAVKANIAMLLGATSVSGRI